MKRARSLVSGLMLGALVHAGGASAQTPPATATDAPAEDVPRAPIMPTVSDPMLAPPPPSAQEVRSLDEAMTLVRQHSPDYLTSLETIRRAEAQSRIALGALLPTLTGLVTYTHQFNQATIALPGPNGTTNSFQSPAADALVESATATWTPLNAHAIHALGTSRVGETAAKLTFSDRRRLIATAIVASMLATLSSLRIAELNRTGLKTALERLALTQARLQYGQGTPLDVDRAEQDVAIARRLVIDGDESLRRSREALGVALGSRTPIGVGNFDFESFQREVAHTCRLNESLENRPDVAAARARLDIAKRTETDALLKIAPTVGVVGQGAHTSAPILAPNWAYSIQAVLTIPFYDGGVRYGQLRDAQAQTAQARAQLEATRLAAIVTATQAVRQVEVARADRDVTPTQRDLAARIDMRTRDSYARGRGTSLDLVTSAQALRQAEINLALIEFQFAEARADAVLQNAECVY